MTDYVEVEVIDGPDAGPAVPGSPGYIDVYDAPPVVVAEGDSGAAEAIVNAAIAAHVNDPTPHPAYDEDIPDLVALFENRLV